MGHALWELTVFSTPFCCEPKAVFKNKVYYFKKIKPLSYHFGGGRNAREYQYIQS